MIIDDINIQRSRTGEVITTVDTVTDWTNLNAKMYIAEDFGGTPIVTLDGSIDDQTNEITFGYDTEDTALLTEDRYVYEIVVYDSGKIFVQTVNEGTVFVVSVIKSDPTV